MEGSEIDRYRNDSGSCRPRPKTVVTGTASSTIRERWYARGEKRAEERVE
jgi:hypothetical protein